MIYDVAVIGGGPAGVTAAVYAKRAGLETVLFEEKYIGGQIVNTHNLENFTGFTTISGYEFGEKLSEQLKYHKISPVMEKVITLELDSEIKTIFTSKNEYKAKNVIIATGASPRKLGIKNEAELTGMGISYCATCDGAFFRNRKVMVAGGGNTALDDAVYLSNICETVYIVHRRDEFRGNKSTVEKLKAMKNVEFILNSEVKELVADEFLKSVKVFNKIENKIHEIEVSALFVAIGNIPNTELVKDKLKLDEAGYIVCNSNQETNINGVFGAGDVCKKTLRQVVTAASDGANAVNTILNFEI
ncbi:MAG: thioredoxin-disulfide reductase [Clostridia bacterium]|nr:thioredoxin-disulfide reductase [Clostridia bacterium]